MKYIKAFIKLSEGSLIIFLECFPSYISAIKFVCSFNKKFINSPQDMRLQKFFLEEIVNVDLTGFTKEYKLNGKLHNINDMPAYIDKEIYFSSNYKRIIKKWYKFGKLHRIDNPAYITIKKYIDTKSVFFSFEEYLQNGLIHRDDGYAIIVHNTNTHEYERYKNNKLHTETDEPSMIIYENNQLKLESWHRNGRLHRKGHPAVKNYEDAVLANVSYYEDGKYLSPHRFHLLYK